jgi:dynactin 1
VPSTRSIPPPSPRAASPLKPGTNQSARTGTRLAPPSPTKRSPIPSIQPQIALKKTVLTPRRSSVYDSTLPMGSSTGTRDHSPDAAALSRGLQIRQVALPTQLPPDRALTSATQPSTTSHLRSPTPPSLPDQRGSVSVYRVLDPTHANKCKVGRE